MNIFQDLFSGKDEMLEFVLLNQFVMFRILKEFCPIPITIETINLQIPDSLQRYFWIFHYFVWIFIKNLSILDVVEKRKM